MSGDHNLGHTCSYYCTRPECIKAQRDELREANEALYKDSRELQTMLEGEREEAEALMRQALETLEWVIAYGTDDHGPSMRGTASALRERLGGEK